MPENASDPTAALLEGTRVVEIGDEQTAYCGRLMAGLGAEVIKVEPVEGCSTRGIGPFYEDEPGPERSLFWWHYGLGKRSVVLDLTSAEGVRDLERLLASADVLLDGTARGMWEEIGLPLDELRGRLPRLIVARMTPFGDDGPWAGYKASDLIHLALGGPMMNCGYDPQPDGTYDLPPIAPQMWHAYHIAGEQLCMNTIGALIDRRRSGRAQMLTCAVHDAVSKNTELDLMSWVYRAATFYRQTCRHAAEVVTPLPSIGATKDGRWVMALARGRSPQLIDLLKRYDMEADLDDTPPEPGGVSRRTRGEAAAHLNEVAQRLVRKFRFADVPWREAQEQGQLWAPAAQAARERRGPALVGARQLRAGRPPRARCRVRLHDEQVGLLRDRLAGRPAGAAARRAHRGDSGGVGGRGAPLCLRHLPPQSGGRGGNGGWLAISLGHAVPAGRGADS